MGACGSSLSAEEQQALAANRAIEKRNRDDFQAEQGKIKLLLLGAGESGKSTIFKQMKILYGTGFGHQTPDELSRWETTVYNNILANFKVLLENVEEFSDESLEGRVEEIKTLSIGSSSVIDAPVGELLVAFWEDDGVQAAWHRRAEFQIQDSLKYYMDEMPRIQDSDYVPTEQDILRTRVRTSGIVEESFKIDNVLFEFFDVGGQRNERKKWIHAFDNVTAVIFVAAINEYDQHLFEDNTMNRIDEAVILFDEICNSPFFRQTSMILFLNKDDLFREKLAEVPFRVDDGPEPRFTDYMGPEVDFDGPSSEIGSPAYEEVYRASSRYLLQLFLNRNRDNNREIYHHVTCATDTSNISVVFKASKDIILQRNLKGSGFAV
ncbi:Guanine nucleotide-binding protein subunit alpha [Hondaea fermentalgiana]|uniref:Guanine nucleotide-binding protein subunit alpha n=1 Tax=Hondaea fermentalgiana TaxID=2315210 RepID=A0A2R5GUI5_9STRA|nr:Guanine nucleotide-binding protein subunit alpha [Hondaea fermentalgiana]|eukprot:GBG32323.1 Guanine nucleotide-binding protein subunit alpha [Hondaea fermentalgiana]